MVLPKGGEWPDSTFTDLPVVMCSISLVLLWVGNALKDATMHALATELQ